MFSEHITIFRTLSFNIWQLKCQQRQSKIASQVLLNLFLYNEMNYQIFLPHPSERSNFGNKSNRLAFQLNSLKTCSNVELLLLEYFVNYVSEHLKYYTKTNIDSIKVSVWTYIRLLLFFIYESVTLKFCYGFFFAVVMVVLTELKKEKKREWKINKKQNATSVLEFDHHDNFVCLRDSILFRHTNWCYFPCSTLFPFCLLMFFFSLLFRAFIFHTWHAIAYYLSFSQNECCHLLCHAKGDTVKRKTRFLMLFAKLTHLCAFYFN